FEQTDQISQNGQISHKQKACQVEFCGESAPSHSECLWDLTIYWSIEKELVDRRAQERLFSGPQL
ncbi:hypothetical protein C241_26790, partial [Bradyrhizobium lupini HPC(L)]